MRKNQIQRLIMEAEELLFRLDDLYKAYDMLVGEEEKQPPRRPPQTTTPHKIPQERWAPISRMLPAPTKADALEEWILRGPIAQEPQAKKPAAKKKGTQRLTDIFPRGFFPEEYGEDW